MTDVIMAIAGVLLMLLKGIFGMDKPKEEVVVTHESPLPKPSEDDVLDSLGIPKPK
jgi:hypothetical protein